ncbi:MFS transporter [Actinosynnema sp. NPDC053489]|uniref:MFS transporter n=1 Tax=Actinosynnema sp. NPDC053489 TaxID=3363916 RepID=UPI0037CA7BE1
MGLRVLLWGRGVSALGDGLWFTTWALFFTRVLGLPPTAVGVGMAVAGAAGLVAAVPLGALADRFDPRPVLVAITVVRGLAMASYLAVDGTWSFLAATVTFTAPANGGNAVRTALITGLVPDNAARVRALARQRVAQHVGYAVGAGLGALVLAADDPSAYALAITGNAVTFGVLAVSVLAVGKPSTGPTPRARVMLRDRPYLAVVATTSVLSLCWAMLSTGLPLWLSRSTHLPLALGGAVVVLSSAGIAVFQVPFARFARTPAQAARTAVRSGVVLAASCALLATTAGGSGATGIALVVAAAVLHVVGELGYVAANWGLSVGLMRDDARGAYQGVNEAATATVQLFGPAVFTVAVGGSGVVGGSGAGGWLAVAAVFLAAVAPVPALTAWAARTRTPAFASNSTR